MDVVEAQGGTASDGEGLLCPWHNMRGLHERGAAGAQDPHRPQDDAIGDQRIGHVVQQEIFMG